MRGRLCLPWVLATAAWMAGGMQAFAQYTPGSAPSAPARDALNDSDTFVSFIDNALPRTQVRTYFDDFTRIRRPTRDAYLFPNFPLPETSVDYSQLTTYGEIAILPSLSAFLATPLLFLDPDVNRNVWGLGDMNFGVKWGCLNLEDLLLTLQFRAYVPTAENSLLGTHQVSLEPALLLNYHLTDYLTVEGEGRYWFPIGANQYNGNFIRYGVGIAYGQRDPNSVWIAPVIEGVGWTILNGHEQVPGIVPTVISSRGENIFNIYGGLRFGLGNSISVYAGYGRAITGEYWSKDVWRLELRFFF
jgi:hypothetical protein